MIVPNCDSATPSLDSETPLQLVSGEFVASVTLSRHFLLRLRERFFPEGLPHPRDLRHSLKSSRIVAARHGTAGQILKHRLAKSLYLVHEKADAIYVLEQSVDGKFRTLRTCYRKSESDWIRDAIRQSRRQRLGTVAEIIAQGPDDSIFEVSPRIPEEPCPVTWRMSASYMEADGRRKTSRLGSMEPLAPTLEDLSPELLPRVLQRIRGMLADRSIPEDRVIAVWVKSRKKGTPVEVWSARSRGTRSTCPQG